MPAALGRNALKILTRLASFNVWKTGSKKQIAVRRGGNKGRDFEAKVDSVEAGRGAYRKGADFRRQEMAKQKANYARQKARSEDSSLTGAERRAASEEMRKLRQRFGNEVTKGGGEKLMRRPAPKKRTPIGDKAPKAPKPIRGHPQLVSQLP